MVYDRNDTNVSSSEWPISCENSTDGRIGGSTLYNIVLTWNETFDSSSTSCICTDFNGTSYNIFLWFLHIATTGMSRSLTPRPCSGALCTIFRPDDGWRPIIAGACDRTRRLDPSKLDRPARRLRCLDNEMQMDDILRKETRETDGSARRETLIYNYDWFPTPQCSHMNRATRSTWAANYAFHAARKPRHLSNIYHPPPPE